MTHAEETRAAAQRFDHPWDERAVDWPMLSPGCVVIEVGGYKGRWALQIAERYAPRLYVFEPQGWAYNVCRDVLGERATVFGYGLGVVDGFAHMNGYETDGCTFVGGDGPMAEMCEIGGVVKRLGLTRIDLMLMNIEGYEYTLLPHMLERGILPDRLMVQFHTFADPSGVATGDIFDRLAEAGYRVAWTYGAVLTAWERAQ